MSDTSKPFAFSQFVPGFDFLKNLASGSAAGATPGMPSLASWVAPTLSVEEVEKRIQELKTVQFWLEQNGHALKATIQALEVQKMTLSTLRGMNVQMEDLANAFTRQAAAATPSFKSPEPEPKAEPRKTERAQEVEEVEEEEEAEEPEEAPAKSAQRSRAGDDGSAPSGDEAGVVDPLQWWGALTQQFQQIASAALQEASNLKMPTMPQATSDGAPARPPARTAKKAAKTTKPATGGSARAAGKTPPPARKRAR